ncbi:MAG: hypothetical protein Q7T25_09435 [Sideroxyarcus sp.]|nr:hypothetical protein [Sideroxyarcus sp.]
MDRYSVLDPYWHIFSRLGNESTGSFVAHIGSHTRKGEHRIAYWQPKATRWRLSAPVGETFIKDVIAEAHRDFVRGHYDLRSMRHMLQVYARNTVPRRWNEHRAKMEKLKEQRAMAALPQFGLF